MFWSKPTEPLAPDEVAQAMQLLTAQVFCRQQAIELRACHERGKLSSIASGSLRCERERAAFTTCSDANLGQVVDTLVKVADTKCQDEVAAYQACKARSLGDDCEAQDLASVMCASRAVLVSARASSS